MPTYPITPETADALHRRFTYHSPFGSQPHRFQALREQAMAFAKLICTECPESPERSLALTKIDEAVMFANAAIARTENYGAPPDRHGRVDVQAKIAAMREELETLMREALAVVRGEVAELQSRFDQAAAAAAEQQQTNSEQNSDGEEKQSQTDGTAEHGHQAGQEEDRAGQQTHAQ